MLVHQGGHLSPLYPKGDCMKASLIMIFLILFVVVPGAHAAARPSEPKRIDLQKTLQFVEDWSKRDKWDKFPESPSFAYYNIYSLKLLKGGVDPEVRRRVIDYLKTCRMNDGGFSSNPEHDPRSSTIFTYYALKTLDLLGALDSIDGKKTAEFIISLTTPDGGILAKPGDRTASLATTYYGLASLALLGGASRCDAEKTIAFINGYREPHKGYCMIREAISMPASTYMAVRSLQILGGLTSEIRNDVISYLKDTRYSGLVRNKKYSTLPTLEELSFVLETLAGLSAVDVVNRKKVTDFIASLYIPENGGFGPEPGLGTTPPSTYHAIFCLNTLGRITRPGPQVAAGLR
jgi:prenyltransferase beta subunit